MNLGKEALKIGAFVASTALLLWISRKLEGTWIGNIVLRGRQ